MIKAIKQFIGFVFFVGPIALFWFIPWYWVILYYNLYWTYTSYVIYEGNKDEKELSLLYCISLPLLFNFFGFLVVILTESKSKKGVEKSTIDNSSYDKPSEVKKTEKSSYQKAIDLETKKRKERISKADFSVSEEEFKAEPIKTLYKLSKVLSREEYLKKAKEIWKEYITSFLNKHYEESDAKFYGKIDQDKDLFIIDLEYVRDDHYRLCPRLRMSNYDYLLKNDVSDMYDLDGFFDGCEQIAHIYEQDNKPGEPCIVFFANSSWGGNYTEEEFEDMGGWYMEGLGYIISINADEEDFDEFFNNFDRNKENASYEDMANLFFSFDQICEYLAKCPIYDYKEALEAGALGEEIDFTSFDISKMENSTYTIVYLFDKDGNEYRYSINESDIPKEINDDDVEINIALKYHNLLNRPVIPDDPEVDGDEDNSYSFKSYTDGLELTDKELESEEAEIITKEFIKSGFKIIENTKDVIKVLEGYYAELSKKDYQLKAMELWKEFFIKKISENGHDISDIDKIFSDKENGFTIGNETEVMLEYDGFKFDNVLFYLWWYENGELSDYEVLDIELPVLPDTATIIFNFKYEEGKVVLSFKNKYDIGFWGNIDEISYTLSRLPIFKLSNNNKLT